MGKLTIEDLVFQGKRVLMRVDFNVPLENGEVSDDKRIRAALPSIRFIMERGGRLVLMSHLGRPQGKPVPEMSLKPCVLVLEKLLGKPVKFATDCIGVEAETAVEALQPGEVLLLENLRYHKEETDNHPDFAAALSAFADVYVNDAFGTAHRAHASTEGITHCIDRCAAGYLLMKEIEYLGKVVESPDKPFVAVLGGAKVSGKIDVISNLLPKVDTILIGGGMAYTFLKAQGKEIGKSLLEADRVALARELQDKGGDRILLPVDCMVSDTFDFNARKVGVLKQVNVDAIPADSYGLDIGPESLRMFKRVLNRSQTIVWNGPMGVFEIEATGKGTFEIARILAEATQKGATTVVGGGDSAAAVSKAGVEDRISHVSTGGGASLEYMEGKVLPGVAALTDK